MSVTITPQDLRDFGVVLQHDEQADDLVALSLDVAQRYAGQVFTFTPGLTILISDVRKPLLPLPRPFANVTAVTINGATLTPASYTVEDWGIRLYSAVPYDNGFPIRGTGSGSGTWPYQASGAPYGAQVMVTADFGDVNPSPTIKQAVLLLCKMFAIQGTEEPLDPRVDRIAVEGYVLDLGKGNQGTLVTTGSLQADRLLDLVSKRKIQVR